MKQELQCKECKAAFQRKGPYHLYCSDKCKREYGKQHGTKGYLLLNCKVCSKPFWSYVNKKYCSRDCYHKNRQFTPEQKRESQRATLLKRYNLELEDYNRMFNEQSGSCFICNTHQSQLTKPLNVDHCHKTNVVRRLLCNKCNSALGLFNDNQERVQRAAEYLKLYEQN